MPEPARNSTLFINGWAVFIHPVFLEQFENIVTAVDRLEAKDPAGYFNRREAKIFGAIMKMAFEVIPGDPTHRMFLQGDTLGAAHKHWRRAKFLGGRYRLFFQFSTAQRAIVLPWVNDEETLRTYGKKTDAYAVFKTMLGKSRPPSDWATLLKEALDEPGARKIARIISRPK
jgi:toxin YhaV